MFKQLSLSMILSSTLLISSTVYAQDSFLSRMGDSVKSEWNNSMNGKSELYIPLRTWHNRATYDHNKLKEFNESPWGLGYGKGYIDEKGDWAGFYAMAFKDSHNKWQPIAGYGYTKRFYNDSGNWHAGIGYTLFMTAREDIFHYIPFPAALPLVSAGYKDFSLQGTYIPGGKGNGNVAFFWAKYSF